MSKFRLAVEERKDIFLYMTKIENLFINEFLPDAPGDYVKVYLFGMMYAQYEQAVDSSTIAKSLSLTEAEVEEAWIYWQSRGIVRMVNGRDADGEEVKTIEFVRQIEMLYGKAETQEDPKALKAAAEASEDMSLYVSMDDMEYDNTIAEKLIDKRLRDLFNRYQDVVNRTLSRQETTRIEDSIRKGGVEPGVYAFAIDYCADLQKFDIAYIGEVAARWTKEGCSSVQDVKDLLEKHSLRNSWYRQVFKALGFNRLWAPADREIMDKWFDEMGCSIEEVLDACKAAAGLRDPNLRYVNKVIENRRLEKGGIRTEFGGESSESRSPVSRKVLAEYFEYLRNEGEQKQKDRIEEIRRKIPEIESLFEKERVINTKMLSIRPGNDNLTDRQRLRADRHAVESSKKELLIRNGYPVDYLNRKYKCDICKDTGYTDDGMVCRCCRERANEAYDWYAEKNK